MSAVSNDFGGYFGIHSKSLETQCGILKAGTREFVIQAAIIMSMCMCKIAS